MTYTEKNKNECEYSVRGITFTKKGREWNHRLLAVNPTAVTWTINRTIYLYE